MIDCKHPARLRFRKGPYLVCDVCMKSELVKRRVEKVSRIKLEDQSPSDVRARLRRGERE